MQLHESVFFCDFFFDFVSGEINKNEYDYMHNINRREKKNAISPSKNDSDEEEKKAANYLSISIQIHMSKVSLLCSDTYAKHFFC